MPEPGATEVVLAFDFGQKHLGVAYGQSITGTATPLPTIGMRNGKARASELRALIEQWRPTRLLVGLPLNMDDSESTVCTAARQFASELARISGLPVVMVDERLSSREANERLGGGRRDNHGMAAAVIAESYFAQH